MRALVYFCLFYVMAFCMGLIWRKNSLAKRKFHKSLPSLISSVGKLNLNDKKRRACLWPQQLVTEQVQNSVCLFLQGFYSSISIDQSPASVVWEQELLCAYSHLTKVKQGWRSSPVYRYGGIKGYVNTELKEANTHGQLVSGSIRTENKVDLFKFCLELTIHLSSTIAVRSQI